MAPATDPDRENRRMAMKALLILVAVAVLVYISVMFKIVKFGA
jgi:hypothetical protein